MSLDRNAYKKTVLDPARHAGNVPPADLVVRYALTASDLNAETAFKARVKEVTDYWQTLSAGNSKLYSKLVHALLAAHAELEQRDALSPAAFRKQREDAAAAARARLAQRAASLAQSLPCVTLAMVERLVEDGGGLLDEREVRAVLRAQNVTVIDPPWQVPTAPPLPVARSLGDHLTLLGLRLSVELVLGAEGLREGFSVKGGFRTRDNKTIGKETLDGLRKSIAARPHDGRKTASSNVIALLAKALETPGKLEELLTWELAGILRPDAAAGLPVSAVAHNATELGLDPGEALELAVTLSAGTAQGAANDASAADANKQVDELLRAGDLREAKELVDSLPADAVNAAIRARLAEALQEVRRILEDADRARDTGDREEEAQLLAQALTRQPDSDVQARLDRIPPPPPTEPRAMADGERIALTWRHSQARTGTVRYRVVRSPAGPATSAQAQELVTETDADSAVDPAPPVGAPNYYTVFATRGTAAWSSGTSAEPVTILPEIGGLELDATATVVTGTWRVLPAMVDVEVLRTEADGGPGKRVAPRSDSLDGFVDDTVRTGVRYEYQVRAVYRTPSGEKLTTTGVVATIRPQGAPVAVLDLSAELVADLHPPMTELRWTEPASGTPEIRLASVPPEWEPGTVVSTATAKSYGRPQSGPVGRAPDGRVSMRIPVRDGTTFLTVFTAGARSVVVGNSVRFAVVNPVTDLRAVRRGSRIWLSWIWPSGATSAVVRWSGDEAQGERELSSREYHDDGGCVVDSGPGAVEVSVMTASRDSAGTVLSAPVTRGVPARPVRVRWSISRRGLWPRQVVLVLTSDGPCEVPTVVVVRGRDGRRPDDPARGVPVAEVPRSRVSPDTPLEHHLGSERQTGPVEALGSFLRDGGGSGLIFSPAHP